MTTFPLLIRSWNNVSIISWKATGELHRPKYITNSSNSPLFVLKAAFHSSPSLILTLLYLHWILSLVKYIAPLTLSINSWIRGSEYLFLLSLHWVSNSLVQDIRSYLSFWQRRRVLHMVILMVVFILFSSVHLRICQVLLTPWYLVNIPCSPSMLLLGLIQLHGPRVIVVVIHQRLFYQRLTPWIANIVGVFFF